MKKRLPYMIAFLFLLIMEILIGAFMNDRFIRPYAGDILVIILLCCLLRSFSPKWPKWPAIWVFLLGAAAELLQLMHLAEWLGVEGTVWGVILGSTFDPADLLCYLAGGVCFSLAEFAGKKACLYRKTKNGYNME